VCAVAPEVSNLICAHGKDGARTWSAHPLQLHLALGPNLWAGTGQALPRSPETHQVGAPEAGAISSAPTAPIAAPSRKNAARSSNLLSGIISRQPKERFRSELNASASLRHRRGNLARRELRVGCGSLKLGRVGPGTSRENGAARNWPEQFKFGFPACPLGLALPGFSVLV